VGALRGGDVGDDAGGADLGLASSYEETMDEAQEAVVAREEDVGLADGRDVEDGHEDLVSGHLVVDLRSCR